MNRIPQLFAFVASAVAVSAFAQAVSSPSASSGPTTTTTGSMYLTPPPATNGPGGSGFSGDTTLERIPSAVRAKADAAHASWLAHGGAEFYPKYTYAGGVTILMLMVPTDETPSASARRHRAMVQACEFMLAADAFDHSVICIAAYDPADGLSMATRNTPVTRASFESAVLHSGNDTQLSGALSAAYHNPAAIEQICSALGLR